LESDVEDMGGSVVTNSTFMSATRRDDGKFLAKIMSPVNGIDEVVVDTIINCAGLDAPNVAQSISTGVKSHDMSIPGRAYYAKGNYFKLTRPSPFTRLIYPMPEAHGLGIHLTVDTEGNARFGPDVEWVNQPDYSVSVDRVGEFARHIKRYFPSLPDETALVPDYAGVRPKLGPSSEAARDFVLWGPQQHKVPGLIHLLGIESPGITSSLALSDFVVREML